MSKDSSSDCWLSSNEKKIFLYYYRLVVKEINLSADLTKTVLSDTVSLVDDLPPKLSID